MHAVMQEVDARISARFSPEPPHSIAHRGRRLLACISRVAKAVGLVQLQGFVGGDSIRYLYKGRYSDNYRTDREPEGTTFVRR